MTASASRAAGGTRRHRVESPAAGRPLSALLAAARQAFTADIVRGRGGRAAHARFADRLDGLVRIIITGAATITQTPVAIGALGGYGRRALCLHSDVDLLIVFAGDIDEPEERFVKAVLHPLWDLGLTVGHQVRTLADFDVRERDNPEFLLALQDARLLAGDAAVFERSLAGVRGTSVECREEILEAVLQLTEERHLRYNDTVYHLEPDVKEAPGGLRDLAAARVLVSVAEQPAPPGVVEWARLEEAEDFLLRVRSVLHLECRRNLNVLGHELQEKVANALGWCPGAEPQRRVEALMGEYFRLAHIVARALTRGERLSGPVARDTTRVALGDNVELTAEGVEFADLRRAEREPASWLNAFEAALAHGAPVSDAALVLFERFGGRYSVRDYLPAVGDRGRLLRLLTPQPGLYARLSELHACGLLVRLFPELQKIAGRVIRDFHHKYTVDEHTLLTIRGLERLLNPDQPSRGRFSGLLWELRAPEVLVLALLYHDVGKWQEENHCEEGLRLVEPMLARLELAPDQRDDVRFLIAEHLEMSRIAFLRDSEDPAVVRQLATRVGTEERLKMLCLMTLADVEAVSTGTLTSWREELLWRLYVDTYNELTRGYGDDVIDGGQAAVAALQTNRPDDIGEAELTAFLEGFPRRYLVSVDAAQVYRHARLSRDIRPNEVHLFLEQKDDVWELSVAAMDKPYLFSNICGVLSYCGMDILRGSAMTSRTGHVLDIVQFTDREGFLEHNAGAAVRLEQILEAVVAGHEDISQLLARKARGRLHRRAPHRVAPVVHVDNEHSPRYTVFEIIAQDEPGLLHSISRVISRHGCDVDLVLISTEGLKAVDVFHLTRGTAKLPEPVRVALRSELQQMLEGEL